MIIIKVEKRHYEMDLESVLKKWQKYYESLFGKGNVVAIPVDHQIEKMDIGDNLKDMKNSPYNPLDENGELCEEIDTSSGRRYKHKKPVSKTKEDGTPAFDQHENSITQSAKFREHVKSRTPEELSHNFIHNLRKDLLPEDSPMKDALK